jgi:hypothetical protein
MNLLWTDETRTLLLRGLPDHSLPLGTRKDPIRCQAVFIDFSELKALAPSPGK